MNDRLAAALADRCTIERELGQGGMATVYLAQDLKHGRRVAVKVLRPELAAVIGAERFLAEIRMTASLQHPHILPLHDSGEAGGFLFYVMPYIEGVTLRDRITREHQLPVADAVRIATEVAGALDYAHRHNVIHRDIKPENILLHDGSALVADFGIALAVSTAGTRMTETGMSLGTPHYMSPEQAMGEREITARSDVYALGCVTYEMLVGEPPFTGPTAQSILARVMTEEPRALTTQRKSIPPHVESAVLTAIEKLPGDRYATAKDFGTALGDATVVPLGHTSTMRARAAHPPSWSSAVRRSAPWTLALLAIGVAAWGRFASRPALDETPVAFSTNIPAFSVYSRLIVSIAVSPDGEAIAYVSDSADGRHLYYRRLSDPVPHLITGADNVWRPFFSPDGKWIAYSNQQKLLKVAVDGGSPVELADAAAYYAAGTWSRSQGILLGVQAGAGGLVRVPADGGASGVLTKATNQHALPKILDDDETVLFIDWGPGYNEDDYLALGSASTGAFTISHVLAAEPLGALDGYLLYTRVDGMLMAVPFDRAHRRITGDPVQIMSGVSGQIGGAALSATGTLAYVPATGNRRLVLLDGSGTHPVSDELRNFASVALSPDGTHLALAVETVHESESASDIWILDRKSGTPSQLTHLGNVGNPVWLPDGKHVVFFTWFDKSPTLWLASSDGGSEPTKLLSRPDNRSFFSASPTPDGAGLVFCARTSDTDVERTALYYLPLAPNAKPESLLPESTNACGGVISPDGRWLAYYSDESGAREVSIRPFRAPGERVQISSHGGSNPLWLGDSRHVVYSGQDKLVSASIQVIASAVTVDHRDPIFPSVRLPAIFALARDGKQLITAVDPSDALQLVVIKHWLTTFRAKIAAVKK